MVANGFLQCNGQQFTIIVKNFKNAFSKLTKAESTWVMSFVFLYLSDKK